MNIDLSKIPAHVLTLKDSEARYNEFKLNINPYLNVSPFYGQRYPTIDEGCYKSSLSLYKTVSPPVLILEDDVHLTTNFSPILNNVPDDADVLYLGTSAWGTKNNTSSFKNLHIEKYNDNYYRIERMTTTHAILFLSNRFWSNMMQVLSENVNKVPIEPVDVHLGRLHEGFKVYAVAKPMFYQHTPYNDYLTSYPLEDIYKEFNP